MSERTYGGQPISRVKELGLAEISVESFNDLIAAAEECEKFEERLSVFKTACCRFEKERDQLRAELETANKEIAQYIAGVNKLRAENSELRTTMAGYIGDIVNLHADNERLRTGLLISVATLEDMRFSTEAMEAASKARRALKGDSHE